MRARDQGEGVIRPRRKTAVVVGVGGFGRGSMEKESRLERARVCLEESKW